MNDSATKIHASFWGADDYLQSPRPVRALNLHLTTYCNLECAECSSSNPRIRYPEHYDTDYLRNAAKFLKDLELVTITGGEPTLNPQFPEIVPKLKEWFKCRYLALETNGAKIVENQTVLEHFDDVLVSHYPENTPEVSFLADLNLGSRPDGPTIHVTKARRAYDPQPCARANFATYVYGRLYPCTYIPEGCENIGIPLTRNWREEIQAVPLPCASCCFANEGACGSEQEIPPLAITGAIVAKQLTSEQSENLDFVSPPWRLPPPPQDNLRIYGLDLDSWMADHAQIVYAPEMSMHQLLIMVESHHPADQYPIDLNFENEAGDIKLCHQIRHPGVIGVKVKIRDFVDKPSDRIIAMRCSSVHWEATGRADASVRKLGLRIRSLRYAVSSRKTDKAPLLNEHQKLLGILNQQITDKEKQISAMKVEIDRLRSRNLTRLLTPSEVLGRKITTILARSIANPFWPVQAVVSLLRPHWQKMRVKFFPRPGDLIQYSPRPLNIRQLNNAEVAVDSDLPTISIVTPSFNQAEFLDRTIGSVIGQGYSNLEYIVQDGGSTDNTREILNKYQFDLSSIESKSDRGQADAINIGFSKSTGEVMGWLNSDDMLIPGCLSFVAKYFRDNPAVDVIYSHRILVDEQDQEIGRWILPNHDNDILGWADYVPQETLFWRRSIWDKAGGQLDANLQFAMDWDLLLRFKQAGAKIVRVATFLGVFRVHRAQKTQAQIEDLGSKEMQKLREQEHGRKIENRQLKRKLTPFLLKASVLQMAYRFRSLF